VVGGEALEGGPGGLADQDDATVARAKSEFDRLVAQYATGDGQIILPHRGAGQRHPVIS